MEWAHSMPSQNAMTLSTMYHPQKINLIYFKQMILDNMLNAQGKRLSQNIVKGVKKIYGLPSCDQFQVSCLGYELNNPLVDSFS